jgi:hypothetical protein
LQSFKLQVELSWDCNCDCRWGCADECHYT